jgi:hypothetical protein
MSNGATAPAYRPTAWAYFPSGDCTIRWQRGDNVAYIFEGKQLDTYPDEPSEAARILDPAVERAWDVLADRTLPAWRDRPAARLRR